MIDENIILILIGAVLVALAIAVIVAIVRAVKKNVRQQNPKPPQKPARDEDNVDLLELLAYYRQQYHQRQIPLEVFEMHEREIAQKLKEKRERSSD